MRSGIVVRMRAAPGVPTAAKGFFLLRTIVGAIVVLIRLPGARLFGPWAEKLPISLLRMMPVPATMTLAPKKSEIVWVRATMLPF